MSARVLRPKTSKRTPKHPFLAYDFEWHPETAETKAKGLAYRIRVASFFDGKNHTSFAHYDYKDERARKSKDPIAAFVACVLTRRYAGHRFYAHWGGIADTLYLFRAIHALKLPTRVIVNGSAAAIVLVEQCSAKGKPCDGPCEHRKHKWSFVDSSFLFRFGLKKLGELIGMAKGGDAGSDWNEQNDEKLTDYNHRDNEILYAAIERLETVANDMGAVLGMTMAATSMDLFRRRYLKSDISTPDKDNLFSKEAYYASRVEPYRFRMAKGYAYDVNSSFVYSMTFPLPGSPIYTTKGLLPDGADPYIADVDIEVPDMYLPPLPYRHTDGRIFFPTGKWSGIYTQTDIELALSVGCTVGAVRRVVVYESRRDLRDFAEDVYAKRTEAKDKFLYTAIKLLGNGAYGKFGESEEKSEFMMHPATTLCARHWKADAAGNVLCLSHGLPGCERCYDACECMTMISPGIWKFDNKREIQHRHTQIGAFITSIARRTLYQGQYSYQDHLHYSDTDCVHLDCIMSPENKRGNLEHTPANSSALGGFKLEGVRTDMVYLAPKIYGGKDGNGDPLIAAKGFRVGGKVFSLERGREVYSEESQQRFADIIAGKPVFDSRMVRPREYLQRMATAPLPYEVQIGALGKRLQLQQRPKRAKCGENNTRAWSVRELRENRPWLSIGRALIVVRAYLDSHNALARTTTFVSIGEIVVR